MKSVLLIEDDPELRPMLARCLEQGGWHVWTAADGEDGLAQARRHRPQAIVCDLLMPRTNGFQVCQALRREPALRQSFIVAVSGRDFRSTRQNALDAGADEFLLKPIDVPQLLALLGQVAGPDAPAPVPAAARHPAPYLKFWGVRGSIPAPGPGTAGFGGNTSCVELRADGEILILDSGTGIRLLGNELLAEFKDRPLHATLLISHTHWDHIQGFPFFNPAYEKNAHLRVVGLEGAREGLATVFAGQMETPYFPVSFGQLAGRIVFDELKDMEFTVGPVEVEAVFANHPGVCAGYKLHTSAGSIAYFPDHESYRGPATAAEDRKLVEFLRGVDILIMDAQYDDAEYRQHQGWGHGCVDDVVSLALRAEVRRLFLFHHDPDHDDAKVQEMEAHARSLVRQHGGGLEVVAAREGMKVALGVKKSHQPGQTK
jgi:phosphoribosyl 1,2-cyclic phosphodiesterase/CheY-like chemotaxis protein